MTDDEIYFRLIHVLDMWNDDRVVTAHSELRDIIDELECEYEERKEGEK